MSSRWNHEINNESHDIILSIPFNNILPFSNNCVGVYCVSELDKCEGKKKRKKKWNCYNSTLWDSEITNRRMMEDNFLPFLFKYKLNFVKQKGETWKVDNVPAQVIQHRHVCVHIVQVVGVGRVVLLVPVDRQRTVQVKDVLLWFRFIIHAVKTHHLCEAPTRDAITFELWLHVNYIN